MKKFLMIISMAALFAACSYHPSNKVDTTEDSVVVVSDSTLVHSIDTTAVDSL